MSSQPVELTERDPWQEARERLARAEARRAIARGIIPIRPPRPRVEPICTAPPMCDERTFRESVEVIARSGLVPRIEQLLPAARGRATGGAPREMTLDALLVGLLVLARLERPVLLRDVVRFYQQGPKRRLARVGLSRVPSERMVSRLFGLLDEHLNPSLNHPGNALLFQAAWWDEVLRVERGENHEPLIEPEITEEREHFEFWVQFAYRIHEILDAKERLLAEVTFLGLHATHPELTHAGSYALDHTDVSSWAAQRSASNRKRVPEHRRTDVDAGWRRQSGKQPEDRMRQIKDVKHSSTGKTWFGYSLTAITRAPEAPEPGEYATDIPLLVEHLDLRPAHRNRITAGVRLVQDMLARQEALGDSRPRSDMLGDREYSASPWWQLQMRELGFEPVFSLTAWQQGENGVLPGSGVLVIDGQPYSPGTPMHLRSLQAPDHFATIEEHAAYAQLIAEREPYRLRQHGQRELLQPWTLTCPASSVVRQARCINKMPSLAFPADKPSIGTALPVFSLNTPPSICAQSTVRIPWEKLPFAQRHTPGSAAWRSSFYRRNNVEGSFGNVKNSAIQDIRRGHVRVMGRSKTQLLLLFTAMAANLRLVALYHRRQEQASKVRPAPAKRQPRPRTRARIEARERALVRQIRAEWEAEAKAQAVSESGDPPEAPA